MDMYFVLSYNIFRKIYDSIEKTKDHAHFLKIFKCHF